MVGDACSRPPITIKSHDLHAGDIRRAMGEKTSTTTRGTFFWVLVGCVSFGLSLAFPFCLPCDGSSLQSFIGFLFHCMISKKAR